MAGADERVLAVIPAVTLTAGMVGKKNRRHSLVVTDQRILFARLTSSHVKELSQQVKRRSPTVPAELPPDVLDLLIQQYLATSPDEILAEHQHNFAVDRSSVSKVRLKLTSSGPTGELSDVLTIKTPDKMYILVLAHPKQARKALRDAGLR